MLTVTEPVKSEREAVRMEPEPLIERSLEIEPPETETIPLMEVEPEPVISEESVPPVILRLPEDRLTPPVIPEALVLKVPAMRLTA